MAIENLISETAARHGIETWALKLRLKERDWDFSLFDASNPAEIGLAAYIIAAKAREVVSARAEAARRDAEMTALRVSMNPGLKCKRCGGEGHIRVIGKSIICFSCNGAGIRRKGK